MHSPTIPHAARAVANPADHQLLQDIDNAQNLVELFLKRADEKGDAPFLGHKTGGQWVTQSWRSAAEHVCLLAEALRRMAVLAPLKLPAANDAMLRPASLGCGREATAIAEAIPAEARSSVRFRLRSKLSMRSSV